MKKGIYVFEFLLIILLAISSCGLPSFWGALISAISTIAVPLLLFSRGFLIKKEGFNTKSLAKELSYLFVVLVILTTLNTIGIVINSLVNDLNIISEIVSLFTINNIISLIMFNAGLSDFGSGMWYLLSLIYTYIILILVSKLKKEKLLYIISYFLLGAGIIIHYLFIIYYPSYANKDILFNNFLLYTLPIVLFGMHFNKEEINLTKKQSLISLCVGLFMLVIEHIIFGKSVLYVGSIIGALGAFYLFKDLDINLSNRGIRAIKNATIISLFSISIILGYIDIFENKYLLYDNKIFPVVKIMTTLSVILIIFVICFIFSKEDVSKGDHSIYSKDDSQENIKEKPIIKSKQKSIKKNYLYHVVYQVFALITPLITTPYISRVFGSEGVGQYSFSFALVSYFVLFASLGFGYYAQREVARNQGNKYEQSKTFYEIFIARLIPVGIVLSVYIVLLLSGVFGSYSLLMLVLTINVISVAVDISYIYQGNEEFGLLALRNILIKVIGLALILIFVKDSDDVWIYTLCNSAVLIGANLSMWTRLPKMIQKVPLKNLEIKKHFVPTLRLFVPTIAISVYTMLDRTLIGLLITETTTKIGSNGELVIVKVADIENGYYEQSEKLVKMALTIVTALGSVMIPRNSQLIKSGDMETFKKNIYKALEFVAFLGFPLCLGMAATANNFSPWFFGSGFDKVPLLIMIFSTLIVSIGVSNVLGIQYLLPSKRDKIYTIAICIGAGVNLTLNLILIPHLYSLGACIASVVGELSVTIAMIIISRKELSYRKVLINSWKPFVSSIFMFFVVYLTSLKMESTIINSLLLVIEGMFIYCILLLLLKDKNIISTIKKIKKKLS